MSASTDTRTSNSPDAGAGSPSQPSAGNAAGQPSAKLRAWATRAPLLPALVFMIIVTQLPMVVTLGISVFDWNALYPEARSFAGVDNYIEVLGDAELRQSV